MRLNQSWWSSAEELVTHEADCGLGLAEYHTGNESKRKDEERKNMERQEQKKGLRRRIKPPARRSGVCETQIDADREWAGRTGKYKRVAGRRDAADSLRTQWLGRKCMVWMNSGVK